MQVLHVLGDYLRYAGRQSASASPPSSRIVVSICTARTGWSLFPFDHPRQRVEISRSPRAATVTSDTSTTELYRTGRSDILELTAASVTRGGPATVSATLHTQKRLPLAYLARSRAASARKNAVLRNGSDRRQRTRCGDISSHTSGSGCIEP